MSAILILVRHGQSQWNLENKFTGWVDIDLTEKGIEEAKSAGQKLKNKVPKIDLSFTSSLIRAQKTLDIILEELGEQPPIERSEKLNERHYGDLQGKNKKETAKIYGQEQVHIWRRSYAIAPPGGESLKMCGERVLPYYEESIVPHLKDEKTVLVVAHGNSLRSLIKHLEGLTEKEIIKRECGTGVPYIYEIDFSGNEFTIKSFTEQS